MDRRAAKSAVSAELSQVGMFDTRSISLGGRALEYRFARRRRRTLGISVDGSGLAVSAPMRAPFRDIESFLRDKERWILSKLDEWAQVPRPEVLRVESGETLPFFGAALTLDVRNGGRAVKQEHDRLVVCAPGPVRVVETLVGWLKTKALETLAPRVEHFASRLGLPAPQVALSSARGQWGVCMEGGLIRLNWRLVHLEPDLGDYVAAHEAAHLIEMNHSKRFWNIVTGLYPAWREAREKLELSGAAIPIIGGAR
jgi:predicted metal-dependent hydrolase